MVHVAGVGDIAQRERRCAECAGLSPRHRMFGDALERFNAEAAGMLELAVRALRVDEPRGRPRDGVSHEALLQVATDVLETCEWSILLRFRPEALSALAPRSRVCGGGPAPKSRMSRMSSGHRRHS